MIVHVGSDGRYTAHVEEPKKIGASVSSPFVMGGGVEVEALAIDANGIYIAPDGKAYTPVTVNVPLGAPLRSVTVVFDFAQFLNNVSWETSAEEKVD